MAAPQPQAAMSDLRWSLIGLVLGTFIGVVAFAPARWVAALLAQVSGSRVLLSEPRGTVWGGDARLVLSGGAASREAVVLPGRISWRLGLLGPGLVLRLGADCCTTEPLVLSARMRWGGWSLALADNSSQWPAAALAGLGAPWNTLQAQGRMLISVQGLSVEWRDGRSSVIGRASLDALELSSRLSTLRPIGSYRLRLIGNGLSAPPQLQLETLQGSLKLSGQGQWNGARWSFRGEASAAAENELVLGNLLNIVGRRQGATSVIALD